MFSAQSFSVVLAATCIIFQILFLWALHYILSKELRNFLPKAAFWLSIAMGLILFWRSPFSAADFDTTPDALEYAQIARKIFNLQPLYFELEGISHPFRYPPWFSGVFLSPVFFFGSSQELGNVIFPVTLFALAGLSFAFIIGQKLAGAWGACLSVALILILPQYRLAARDVLADVPLACLALAGLLLFLQEKNYNRRYFFCAGVIAGLAGAIKLTGAIILLPFLLRAIDTPLWKDRSKNLLILLAIPLACLIGTLLYNFIYFADAFRNGYQYWTSIPYDYLELTFSLSYLPANLEAAFVQSGIFIILLILVLLEITERRILNFSEQAGPISALSSLRQFCLMLAGLEVIVQLVYFYSSARLYTVPACLLAVYCAVRLGRFAQIFAPSATARNLVYAFTLLVVLGRGYLNWLELPKNRLAVETLREKTPSTAVIVSGFSAAYFAALLDSQRSYLPISRRVEYASKLVAPRRLDLPGEVLENISPFNHRSPELIKAGATEAIKACALESPQLVKDLLQNGREVFVETSAVSIQEFELLKKQFELKLLHPQLYSLQSKAFASTIEGEAP